MATKWLAFHFFVRALAIPANLTYELPTVSNLTVPNWRILPRIEIDDLAFSGRYDSSVRLADVEIPTLNEFSTILQGRAANERVIPGQYYDYAGNLDRVELCISITGPRTDDPITWGHLTTIYTEAVHLLRDGEWEEVQQHPVDITIDRTNGDRVRMTIHALRHRDINQQWNTEIERTFGFWYPDRHLDSDNANRLFGRAIRKFKGDMLHEHQTLYTEWDFVIEYGNLRLECAPGSDQPQPVPMVDWILFLRQLQGFFETQTGGFYGFGVDLIPRDRDGDEVLGFLLLSQTYAAFPSPSETGAEASVNQTLAMDVTINATSTAAYNRPSSLAHIEEVS